MIIQLTMFHGELYMQTKERHTRRLRMLLPEDAGQLARMD